MSKYTPGPWSVYETKTSNWLVYASNGIANACPEGQLVANCGVTALPATREELDANARLIAAAPELLQALKLIIASGFAYGVEAGKAAIAKAEGK
jgi:hypothetical protein